MPYPRAIAPLLVLLSASTAWADTITLVAGGGNGPDGAEATTAKLLQPFGGARCGRKRI